MAEGGDEWELSKENVQPLRQGRAMSTLQEALAPQDSANHNAIQQKKQAFELELRFYKGDDPLDVWDRYIKWAEQAFPQGGNESNLCPLLERAVRIFHQEQHYYGDLRYLNICLKFALFCTEPADLYNYLHSQGIGILHAQLYITWAEDYEAKGNYKKADSIFQDGIQRSAGPLEKLKTHHKHFQARVSRQILQGMSDSEDSAVTEPPRTSLVDLKAKGKNKAKAPINRVGDALKSGNQGSSAVSAPPQQIPSQSRFAVFDENAGASVSGGSAAMTAQPWVALPPARGKENEQKAGPWNSGRPSRSGHQTPNEPPQSLPSFTPYVDEMVQQQTVTPCKINPSVSSVLSARKPGKEENPLQWLQSDSQGKEEMVMYCKSKIYAGVAEFSFEEIRAEIYMAKIRKMREEDLQASALRRQEMERQIEEMEKQLKARGVTIQETVADQDVHLGQSFKIYCGDEKPAPEEEESSTAEGAEVGAASMQCSLTAAALPSCEILTVAQNRLASEASSAQPSDVPFTIFDETHEAEPGVAQNSMPPPKRRPLATITQALGKPEDAQRGDSIDYIEPLSEEAIVTGSGRNKTLHADPEDTCEFIRAAQLASTPFQKEDEPKRAETSGQARMPLREKMPLSDESYIQVVDPKKLSPILEASQEDTRSSVSSISTGSSCLSASKTLIISEKPDLVSQISGVYEQALEGASASAVSTELQRAVLEAMPVVFTSEAIIQEAGLLPPMGAQQVVLLGTDSYDLKCERLLGDGSRLYMGNPTNCDMESYIGAALKVDVRPLPWDFYVVHQLKERLGDSFQTSFVEQSNCYLFPDGCVALYKDVCLFSIQDILQDSEDMVEQVAILLAYNLLCLGEKLLSAEIVHGDLRPETLLLDVELFNLSSCGDMNNCLRLIDFSHSMDLRRCLSLPAQAFPIAQTEYGQQILIPQASPYHVDLLGIANVVHLMLFKIPLQLQQTDSSWKITSEVPRWWNRNLWKNFFSTILCSSHRATADVLKYLKDQMAQLCERSFQDEVCSYFMSLEMRLNPL